MSRRLIVTGGSRARELVLVDTLVVGRDPACDISETKDPLLSRRHAEFTADDGAAMVRDLGSRNGILVNGVKTPEARARARRRRADRPSAGEVRRRSRVRSSTCRRSSRRRRGDDAILDAPTVRLERRR